MPNSLSSIAQYSQLVAAIPNAYPEVKSSRLALWPSGIKSAVLEGEIVFQGDVRLNVYEEIDFASAEILTYSYEVYRGSQKLYWYDPWPHPNDPHLARTFPHHKHIPPDIKHHRVPAPRIGFTAPNLILLVEEIIRDLL